MTSFNLHNCPARYSTIIMAISMIILSLIEVQRLTQGHTPRDGKAYHQDSDSVECRDQES